MANWDYRVFWDEALSQIKEALGEHEFSMWFNLSYESATESSISVQVPSAFYRDQVSRLYQKMIESKLHELSGKPLTLSFVVIKPSAPVAQAKTREGPSKGEQQKESGESKKPQRGPSPAKGKHPQLRSDHTFDTFVVGENNSFAANAAVISSRILLRRRAPV